MIYHMSMICLTPWELQPALTGFECFSWWWALPLLHQPGRVTQSCKICKASTCCIMLHVSWRFTAVLDILLYLGYATDIYRYSTKTPRLKEADVQTRRRRLGSTVLQLFSSMGRCPIRSRSSSPFQSLRGSWNTASLAVAPDASQRTAAVNQLQLQSFRSATQDSASLRKTQKRLKWCWRCSKSLDVNVMHWRHEGIMNRTQGLRPEEFSAPCHFDSWGFVCETHQIWAAEEVYCLVHRCTAGLTKSVHRCKSHVWSEPSSKKKNVEERRRGQI